MDLGPLCTKENMFARARVHVRDGKRRVILLMLSNAHKPNGCQRSLPSFWQLMWLIQTVA